MISINNTGDTVIMLLVAAGAGLLGGIGAGLLEIRSNPEKAKECAGTVFSSIVLGGIAAVAILYFFPPEETSSTTVEGATELIKEYNLTKLVALALIVGSAGASFLLVLQKKTLAIAEAKDEVAEKTAEVTQKDGEVKTVKAQANEALESVGKQATALLKASAVEGTAPAVRAAMKKVQVGEPTQAATDAVSVAVKQVGSHVESAGDQIESVVEEAQQRISAGPEETDTPDGAGASVDQH